MDKQDFNELVELAMRQPGRAAMKPVVEKELLHYDIFHALDKAGLLKELVFQGGTSLRLCRGSNRFSEDLGFAGGKGFCAAQMKDIKACIETHIGQRYGLSVQVKEPKEMALAPEYESVGINKWQISVETSPLQRDLPRQRAKLEIANVPAYTSELVPLRSNYDFLQGYDFILVNAESIEEITADKLIAFPATSKTIRYRDIWDLAWMNQQGARLRPELVVQKISDYGIEQYPDLLDAAIARLPEIVKDRRFKEQMSRFIDSDTIAGTLNDPRFLDYLIATVGNQFDAVRKHLSEAGNSEPDFRM